MQDFLTQFTVKVLGNLTVVDYAAGLFFALIGAILSLRLKAKKRNVKSENTPVKFSWSFLLQDNAQRLFTGFLVTFTVFRFAPEILQQDFSIFYAFLIGLLNDQAAGLISKLQLKARK